MTSPSAIDPRLLSILVCPQDREGLYLIEREGVLFNPRLSITYPIIDEIPVMLAEESSPVAPDEAERMLAIVQKLDLSLTGNPSD